MGLNIANRSPLGRADVDTADTATTNMQAVAGGFGGAGGANLFNCHAARSIIVYAECSAASKTLTGRFVLYDGDYRVIGRSSAVSVASDATKRDGASGTYLCEPDTVDSMGAEFARFFVEGVDSAMWQILSVPSGYVV